MNEYEAKTLRRKARIAARIRGYGDWSEDLAQDAMVSWLSGRGKKQTATQAVFDAARREFGRKELKGSDDRRSIRDHAIPIDSLRNVSGAKGPSDPNELNGMLVDLTPVECAVVKLTYVWGLSLLEIGDAFGRTETWACKQLKGAQQTVLEWYKSEIGLP